MSEQKLRNSGRTVVVNFYQIYTSSIFNTDKKVLSYLLISFAAVSCVSWITERSEPYLSSGEDSTYTAEFSIKGVCYIGRWAWCPWYDGHLLPLSRFGQYSHCFADLPSIRPK